MYSIPVRDKTAVGYQTCQGACEMFESKKSTTAIYVALAMLMALSLPAQAA